MILEFETTDGGFSSCFSAGRGQKRITIRLNIVKMTISWQFYQRCLQSLPHLVASIRKSWPIGTFFQAT
jgi:hypothetical protein